MLVMHLTAKASNHKLLLLIDLAATAEPARNDLMRCEFLLNNFDLHRSESIVLASLNSTRGA
jgi:hypothetical protein